MAADYSLAILDDDFIILVNMSLSKRNICTHACAYMSESRSSLLASHSLY